MHPHIEYAKIQTDDVFDDGSHIVYVNASMVDEETPLGQLMHDFRCANPDEMYYDVLAERTERFKESLIK